MNGEREPPVVASKPVPSPVQDIYEDFKQRRSGLLLALVDGAFWLRWVTLQSAGWRGVATHDSWLLLLLLSLQMPSNYTTCAARTRRTCACMVSEQMGACLQSGTAAYPAASGQAHQT